ERSRYPAQRDHHLRSCIDAPLDRVAVLSARAQPDLRGISLHRGQSLGGDRRRTLSRGRGGVSDADPERTERARSQVSAEVFSAEEVNLDIDMMGCGKTCA